MDILWSLVVLLLALWSTEVTAVRFNLLPNTKRCLKEEMRKGVVVSGEYELTDGAARADLQITDSKAHVAYSRESIDKGRFAVVADEDDIFDFCVIAHPAAVTQAREVHLEMKHGVEAKNYEELAHVSKLKPMELELAKLEDLSSSIVSDFEYMKAREQEMRDTNESTNTRVLYLSVFSMCCLLGLATWQVLYLRRFFKAKKLID